MSDPYTDLILASAPLFDLACTDGSGTTFTDATGHGHTGIGTNAVTGSATGFLVGQTCGRILFDSSTMSPVVSALLNDNAGGFIDIAGASTFPQGGADALSLEIWTACANDSNKPSLVFGFMAADYNDGFCVLAIHGASESFTPFPQMAITSNNQAKSAVATGHGPATGRCWHHYCATWDGTSFMLYQDGTPMTVSIVITGGIPIFTPAVAQIVIPWSFASHADVMHAALYDHVLSATDVAQHYAAAWPRTDASCFTDDVIPTGPIPFPVVIPPAAWLRLGHSSGRSWVQQNGEQVQIRAGNQDVLDLPLARSVAPVSDYVGRDPSTQLPVWCPPPPQPDISGLQPLPTDDDKVCGIARFVGQKIADAYSWLITETETAMTTWIANRDMAVADLEVMLSFLLPDTTSLLSILNPLLNAVTTVQIQDIRATINPLTPGQKEDIVGMVYCALKKTSGSGPLATDAWITQMKVYVDAYPYWLTRIDGISTSPIFMKSAFDTLHDDWASWAAIGANAPSTTCGQFTCAAWDTGITAGGGWSGG